MYTAMQYSESKNMVREVIPTNHFKKIRDGLLQKKQLLLQDYNDLIEQLTKRLKMGMLFGEQPVYAKFD